MALIAGLVAALTVAYIVYQIVPVPAAYWTGRLEETLGREESEYLPAWQAVLLALSDPLRRFAPAQFVEGIATRLYWAQLQGAWKTWEAGPFLALCVLAASGGFLAGMVAIGSSGGGLLGALVGFYLPQVMLGSKSEGAIRQFRRQLPEMTQLIAMEVATGGSLEQALERMSRGQSLVSAWFRDTLQAARGRLLFSSRERQGLLRQRAAASGLKELHALAVQLDAVHRQGTGGKELLSALALSSAAEYLADVEKQAEALPTKLAMPSVLFFFMPFTVAVLLPVGIPLLQSLSGGL